MQVPSTMYNKAMKWSDYEEWLVAICTELELMDEMKVWELISNHWVFEFKTNNQKGGVMIAHSFFLSLVLLCFPFISLLAKCLIPASRNSLIPFYSNAFGANRSFPEYSLVLPNLLSPSLTFHSLCHTSHDKHI